MYIDSEALEGWINFHNHCIEENFICNFLEDTIKAFKNFNKEQINNYKKYKQIIEELKQEIEERCEKRFERFRKERGK